MPKSDWFLCFKLIVPSTLLAPATNSGTYEATKPQRYIRSHQTASPSRNPVFYTLTKIQKPTLVGRQIMSGCNGPTERISAFLDRLLQPIAQRQVSYLKDSMDFIYFMESTDVPKHAIIVSMDVTSLYTNIPQKEGINTICKAYDILTTKIDPQFQ